MSLSEGAQEAKRGPLVTPGKHVFKQSKQAPEEVSSDHTLCIMCFTKGTADKQLQLETLVKSRLDVRQYLSALRYGS